MSNPYVYSILKLFLIKQIFDKEKSSRATSKSWAQFWPKITPACTCKYLITITDKVRNHSLIFPEKVKPCNKFISSSLLNKLNEFLMNLENLSQEDLGEPILDRVLEPGDCLYFPRGVIHQASTPSNSHSLHITLSVYQKNCWSDYMEKVSI